MKEKLLSKIRRLKSIAGRRGKRLDSDSKEEAESIMKWLKRKGFSNEQISKFSKGRWKPNTVKNYTTGVETEEEVEQEVVSLINKMLERDLNLKDLEVGISVHDKLEDEGIDIAELLIALSDLKEEGTSPSEFLSLKEKMERKGLSLNQIEEALNYKGELEASGFDLEFLPKLLEAAEKYGPEEAVEAINRKEGLEELKKEEKEVKDQIEELKGKKSRLKEKVKNEEKDLESIKKRRKEVKKEAKEKKEALQLLKEVRQLGFNKEDLREIKDQGGKFGGKDKLLEAISEYESLEKVKYKRGELERKYASMKSVIDTFQELFERKGFGKQEVETLYKVSEEYGGFIEALEALEDYGSKKELEKEIEGLEAKIEKKEEKLKELDKRIARKKGKLESLKEEQEEGLKSLKNKKAEHREEIRDLKEREGKLESKLEEYKEVVNFLNLFKEPGAVEELDRVFIRRMMQVVLERFRHWVREHEEKLREAGKSPDMVVNDISLLLDEVKEL